MIPVVSIVGRSNSGKTTLVEKLIRELTERGYRVATVKHDAHRFDIDIPGKDSYRHAQAGASPSIISSPEKVAMVKRVEEETPLDEVIETYVSDADLVITEGYKRQNKPKIEVFSAEPELISAHSELVAVAGPPDADPPLANVPFYSRDDFKAIADMIQEKYLGDAAAT